MKKFLRIVIIADTFPPLRTSGAVQLRDLSKEFLRQGHHITVILPAADIETRWQINDYHGITILRLKAPQTKDTSYVIRTINEFIMPFKMYENFKISPLVNKKIKKKSKNIN